MQASRGYRCAEAATSSGPRSAFAALDVDVGEPVKPFGQVPVALAERLHGGRDEHEAGESGVEQERDGNAESHLLEHEQLAAGEAAEDGDDDQGGAGDDAAGGADAVGDRVAVV